MTESQFWSLFILLSACAFGIGACFDELIAIRNTLAVPRADHKEAQP